LISTLGVWLILIPPLAPLASITPQLLVHDYGDGDMEQALPPNSPTEHGGGDELNSGSYTLLLPTDSDDNLF
jgi:hypothetical protein